MSDARVSQPPPDEAEYREQVLERFTARALADQPVHASDNFRLRVSRVHHRATGRAKLRRCAL